VGPQQGSRSFFVLLLHQGKFIHKEQLCEDLFMNSDYDRAMVNLQVTVHRLRKSLSRFSRHIISILYQDGAYALQINAAEYDVYQLEALEHETSISALESVWSLYRGTFLEGKSYHWLEPERQRLKGVLERVVMRLMQARMAQDDALRVQDDFKRLVALVHPSKALESLYLQSLAAWADPERLEKAQIELARLKQQ